MLAFSIILRRSKRLIIQLSVQTPDCTLTFQIEVFQKSQQELPRPKLMVGTESFWSRVKTFLEEIAKTILLANQ